MKKLQLTAILISFCALTGCIQIDGVHVLHASGDDTGTYRLTMNGLTFAMLSSDSQYAKMMRDLRTWSRPSTQFDDLAHIQDLSGNASMEHFYREFSCRPAPVAGFTDCHYAFELPEDFAKSMGWSVDWDVVLQPGMKVVDSNHHRRLRRGGQDHLIWYFNGNEESAARVDFTIRARRGQ